MILSDDELKRYDRQMMIDGWGIKGQEKLKASKVTIVGVGGLGCPVSIYLAASGVGNLVLIDSGRFELSNLNRQILGWTDDVDRLKVESAKEKLGALNPEIDITAVNESIEEENVEELISKSNVVVDALDNWHTRFLLNRACVKQGIPLIHAGISGFYGQAMTIIPGKGPCLRCVLPENPPELERFPVLGSTPGLFAMIQATETLKVILDIGEPLVGRMLIFDGTDASFITVELNRSENCHICGAL